MESPPKIKSEDSPDLAAYTEVTGVSRSGRVRKKSSKLTDFESLDEIDVRFKRKAERPPKSPQKNIKVEPSMGGDMYDDSDGYLDEELMEIKDEPLDVDDWGDDDDDDLGDDDNEGGDLGSESLHVDEDSTDIPKETTNFSQAQSLYLSEKQAKKNVLVKDGQVVQRKKAQRKDKGKSRFTAYMLWAREIRPGIIQANQHMDFSAVNKRLGELWALVPTTQKYNWKRRAKRLAAKGNQKGSMISTGKAAKQAQNVARSNLINKGGVKPTQMIRSHTKPESNQSVAGSTSKVSISTPKSSRNTSSSATDHSPPSNYKVTGRTPIDVAAHIKLLGESLNNIGQKLKEHEGQIAVSGSLSVLLDSMLCVLGPLTCLTAQVEQMRGAVPDTTLMNILDNIAYIMPGIV